MRSDDKLGTDQRDRPLWNVERTLPLSPGPLPGVPGRGRTYFAKNVSYSRRGCFRSAMDSRQRPLDDAAVNIVTSIVAIAADPPRGSGLVEANAS